MVMNKRPRPASLARAPRLALVLAAALALAGCAGVPRATPSGHSGDTPPSRPVTLMLDWYPNADHAGIFAAIDRGDFLRAGLKVSPQVPSSTTAPLTLVAAGKVPFAISYEPDTLIAVAQGLPVQAVFALVQEPLNSVITLKSSGITRPRQLQGKSVGTAGLPGDTAILDAVVRADHGNPARVRQVNVGYNLVPSLIGHKVDAIIGGYWNWEAVEIAQAGHPVNVMRLQDWGVPNYNELVVVTSDKIARDDPQLVRAFDAALSQGLAYAAAHPGVSLRELLKANPSLSRKLVARSLQLLRPAWKGKAPQYGYMSPGQWRVYVQWMLKEKLLPHAVPVARAMTDAFLPGR